MFVLRRALRYGCHAQESTSLRSRWALHIIYAKRGQFVKVVQMETHHYTTLIPIRAFLFARAKVRTLLGLSQDDHFATFVPRGGRGRTLPRSCQVEHFPTQVPKECISQRSCSAENSLPSCQEREGRLIYFPTLLVAFFEPLIFVTKPIDFI